MRRADRLFQIVQQLRGRRLTTARTLADALGISVRTVYRDIRDLSLSGVPIEGEAGVGYRLGAGFDLPPIMFTIEEVEALVAGARMVEAWGDKALSTQVRSALAKIAQAMPRARRMELEQTPLYAPSFHVPRQASALLAEMRTAITRRHKVVIVYSNADGATTERTLWPLGLFFWGTAWSVAAWCELRGDFRNFRLDRIGECTLSGATFRDMAGRRLADYLLRSREELQS